MVARTNEPERYVFSYAVARLCLSLLALTVLGGIILMVRFSRDTAWLLVAYAITIPLQILKVNWLFYARQQMFIENILQVVEKIAYALCLFLLFIFIKWIILVPLALVISSLIAAALGWILFLRQTERPLIWKNRF